MSEKTKVVERFYRGDASRGTPGVGLGLESGAGRGQAARQRARVLGSSSGTARRDHGSRSTQRPWPLRHRRRSSRSRTRSLHRQHWPPPEPQRNISGCSSAASRTRTEGSSATSTLARFRDYLQRPDCFVWVALHDAAASELGGMQQAFGLHPLAVEDAQTGHQRPKIEEYGDSLFAVLHIVEPHEDELHVGELAIFAGRNYVFSVRNHAAKGLSGRACTMRARAGSAAPGTRVTFCTR